MISAESKQAIRSLCPEVDQQIVEGFFAGMDDDYFHTFAPEDVATHIRMSATIDANRRVRARITPRAAVGEFDVVIVGFDYLSEFSIFCGLLSAFALDIRTGDIHSFSRQISKSSPRRIVDAFHVGVKPGESFDEAKQREFEQELGTLAQLLATGAADQALERLNRFLTERIERMNEPLIGLSSPVEIRFDNQFSPEWTVMETRSEDAFALLYAVSNALAMQGVYIHKVKIRNAEREAVNRFFIANRWRRKIESAAEQERLRMAVVMIKQFTRFLPEAPDPAKAMRHFDQLLDRIAEEEFPDPILSFLTREEGMNLLAHLLGSSDFLWDDFLRAHFAELLPLTVGAVYDRPGAHRAPLQLGNKAALNRFKDTELFLIDARHLLQPQATLMEFSNALTELAEVVIGEAAKICYENLGKPPGSFAVFGLGKFGGREMGYASDLELLFVHEAPGNAPVFEKLALQAADFIDARDKGIFHIDMRLRPYGEKGAPSTPFEQFAKYYSVGGPASPFERQALIKLRRVAGNEELGRRVEAHRDAFTYSDAPWDWQNALHLRRRQMRELVKPGEINVKYSAGGIVDIEYAVQYLQLLNGRDHPEVRLPNTLEALDRLRRLQIIREPDYRVLHAAYLFLRNLIDALRIVRGDASDLVLPDEASEEFKSLARRLGYREPDRKKGALRLIADIRSAMQQVHDYFLLRFSLAE